MKKNSNKHQNEKNDNRDQKPRPNSTNGRYEMNEKYRKYIHVKMPRYSRRGHDPHDASLSHVGDLESITPDPIAPFSEKLGKLTRALSW